jgi:putative ABC transport system substrate-binding protein
MDLMLARERADALFVLRTLFNSRGVQFNFDGARVPAASPTAVVAGGLSYGADLSDMSRQVGVYTGSILKGAKPPSSMVAVSKFKFAINLQAARTLGIKLPPHAHDCHDDGG